MFQRVSASSGMKGPLHCPRIDSERTGTIYVPEGIEKNVVIRGINFPQVKYCRLLEGHIVTKLYFSSVTCTSKNRSGWEEGCWEEECSISVSV